MNSPNAGELFTGAVAKLYEQYLVPLLFEPYALDLAQRLASRGPARVLELAAGTGVVTRALGSALPRSEIVATDWSQPMLDVAAEIGTPRPVVWRQADAMELPFVDGTFDAVVCQFGVMFFPDKAKAYSEAHRVLARGGVLLFNVWDRIEENELAHTVEAALATVFPDDPPRFMGRTPHGYHQPGVVARDLERGGFRSPPQFATVAARSRAPSAADAAVAYCQGTPLRGEIVARDAARLDEATQTSAKAIAERFGPGPVDAKMQAHVVTIER